MIEPYTSSSEAKETILHTAHSSIYIQSFLYATSLLRTHLPHSLLATHRKTQSIMGFFHRNSSEEKRPDTTPSQIPSIPPPAYPTESRSTYPTEKQQIPQYQQGQAGFGAPSSSATGGSTFAALLLSRSDRIRIIGFPGTIVTPIDTAIKAVWTPGIQKQQAYDQASWEWKLSGNPCKFRVLISQISQSRTVYIVAKSFTEEMQRGCLLEYG